MQRFVVSVFLVTSQIWRIREKFNDSGILIYLHRDRCHLVNCREAPNWETSKMLQFSIIIGISSICSATCAWIASIWRWIIFRRIWTLNWFSSEFWLSLFFTGFNFISTKYWELFLLWFCNRESLFSHKFLKILTNFSIPGAWKTKQFLTI